MMIFFVFID